MVVKRSITVLVIVLSALSIKAQSRYYIGLDIGPKFDLYRLASSGARPFDNSIEIANPMAATFGVTGGVLTQEGYQLEAGIYKSDYRVNVTLFTEDGGAYFTNTPINTFTSYMIPFNFNRVKSWQGKYEPRHLIFGTGFTLLAFTKLGIEETYFSPQVPIDPNNLNQGNISYTITDNGFNAQVVMLNLNIGYQYPINESVNISISANPKLGIAGNNFFDITHTTPNHAAIRNSIFTSGTSMQLNIGFRYFLDESTE